MVDVGEMNVIVLVQIAVLAACRTVQNFRLHSPLLSSLLLIQICKLPNYWYFFLYVGFENLLAYKLMVSNAYFLSLAFGHTSPEPGFCFGDSLMLPLLLPLSRMDGFAFPTRLFRRLHRCVQKNTILVHSKMVHPQPSLGCT